MEEVTDTKPKMCFNVMANMMEVYKIKLADEAAQGHSHTHIPIELALFLVERAQAWERLEHDERVHHRSQSL